MHVSVSILFFNPKQRILNFSKVFCLRKLVNTNKFLTNTSNGVKAFYPTIIAVIPELRSTTVHYVHFDNFNYKFSSFFGSNDYPLQNVPRFKYRLSKTDWECVEIYSKIFFRHNNVLRRLINSSIGFLSDLHGLK